MKTKSEIDALKDLKKAYKAVLKRESDRVEKKLGGQNKAASLRQQETEEALEGFPSNSASGVLVHDYCCYVFHVDNIAVREKKSERG